MGPLPGIAVWGLRRNDNGRCDKCEKDRLVVWVEELDGFRCGLCLCPQATREQYHFTRRPRETEPGASIEEILQKMRDGGLDVDD
jgi:hypothetical protein